MGVLGSLLSAQMKKPMHCSNCIIGQKQRKHKNNIAVADSKHFILSTAKWANGYVYYLHNYKH